MKKMWWLVSLLALPMAAAGPLDYVKGVWSKILSVGNLDFIGVSDTVAFTRILIWILTFAIFFAVASILPVRDKTSKNPLFQRAQAGVISAALATITAVFLPVQAILAVGVGWATAVALLLIGGPVLGIGAMLWNINKAFDQPKDTKGIVIIKLILTLLLFWILSAMGNEVRVVGVAPSASVAGSMAQFIDWALLIVSIMLIWYIVKFFIAPPPTDEERAKADKEWQEGGDAMRKAISQKFTQQKSLQEARENMERRQQEVLKPQAHLYKAIEACENLVTALVSGVRTPQDKEEAVKIAHRELNILKKNLRDAIRSLRYSRRKERKNSKLSDNFNTLCEHAIVAFDAAKEIDLPKPNAGDWDSKVRAVEKKAIKEVRSVCGSIVNALDLFIEAEKVELSKNALAQRVDQQAQQAQAAANPHPAALARMMEARRRAALGNQRGRGGRP